MATEANGSIGGHGHQQQRSFAKSISKHTALQIRQSATATVKACSEQARPKLRVVDPVDYEGELSSRRKELEREHYLHLLLFPQQDVTVSEEEWRHRTDVHSVPPDALKLPTHLLTSECLKFYTSEWHRVTYNYSKFSSSFSTVISPEYRESLPLETFEVDLIDEEKRNGLYSESSVGGVPLTKRGYLFKGPFPQDGGISVSMKNYRKRWFTLTGGPSEGGYTLTLYKDEKSSHIKGKISLDTCTEVKPTSRYKAHGFDILTEDDKVFYPLAADSDGELAEWSSVLTRAIGMETEEIDTGVNPMTSFYSQDTLKDSGSKRIDIPPAMLEFSPSVEEASARNREKDRHPLFHVYPELMCPSATVDHHKPHAPLPDEKFGFRFLAHCRELRFKLMADHRGALCHVEPFFLSLALFDAHKGVKLSEDFHVDLNAQHLRDMVPPVGSAMETGPHPLSEKAASVREAIFSVTFPHPEVYLVARVEKVMQGGITACAEPYLKALDNSKTGQKLSQQMSAVCLRLGHYRMPFAWAARPLFNQLEELDTNAEWTPLYKQERERLCDEELIKTLADFKSLHKGKLQVIPGLIRVDVSPLPTKGTKLALTPSLLPSSHLHTLTTGDTSPMDALINGPEGSLALEVQEFPPLAAYHPHTHHHPHLSLTHLLHVYPVSLKYDAQKSFAKARNIACCVQFKDSDDKAALPLPVIYSQSDSSPAVFTDRATAAVLYHCTTPWYYTEVKVQLPVLLKPSHHLLFTFYHVSCDVAKAAKSSNSKTSTKQPPVESTVGYAWLPLLDKDGRLLGDGHAVPVATTLPSDYLALGSSSSTPQHGRGGASSPDIRWVDGRKAIFKVNTSLHSTIYSQEAELQQFFAQCERLHRTTGSPPSMADLLAAIKGLGELALSPLVQFLPVVLTQLFKLLSHSSKDVENIKPDVLRLLISLVDKVVTADGTELLRSYIEYMFVTEVDSSHKKAVHDELARLLVQYMRSPNNQHLSQLLEHLWFFLEIMMKSMAQYLVIAKKLTSSRKTRYPEDFGWNVTTVVESILTHIRKRHSDLSAKKANRSLADFVRRAFSFMDRGVVFKIVARYLEAFSYRENYHLSKLKLEFLRIVCEHEHFIPLNLPFPVSPEGVEYSLSDEFCRRHFLLGVLLREVESSLQYEVGSVRRHAIKILRNMLAKHDCDPRYADPGQRARIAALYFPLIPLVLDHVTRLDSGSAHYISPMLNATSMAFYQSRSAPPGQFDSVPPPSATSTLQHGSGTIDKGERPPMSASRGTFSKANRPLTPSRALDSQSEISLDPEMSLLSDSVFLTPAPPPSSSSAAMDAMAMGQLDRLGMEETRDLVISALFVLKHVDSGVMLHWWKECLQAASQWPTGYDDPSSSSSSPLPPPLSRLMDFFDLLQTALYTFKFHGSLAINLKHTRNITVLEQQSPAPSLHPPPASSKEIKMAKKASVISLTGAAAAAAAYPSTASLALPKQKAHSQSMGSLLATTALVARSVSPATSKEEVEVHVKVEGALANEVGLIVLSLLDNFAAHFKSELRREEGDNLLMVKYFTTLLSFLQVNQSLTLQTHVFASLRAFVHKFRETLFKGKADFCGILCYEILQCCNSRLSSTRTEATVLLYLLMRCNFEYFKGHGFVRTHLQSTIAVSKLVATLLGQSDAHLRRSLTAIAAFVSQDAKHKNTGFPAEVKDLMKRLKTVLSSTAQMKMHQNDPEKLVDLHYSLAKSYANFPELRETWLDSMAALHLKYGNYAEAAHCCIHIAALVAEYLKIKGRFPAGSSVFSVISPNIEREERGIKEDRETTDEQAYTERNLTVLLESSISYLEQAELYEMMSESFKILQPFYERNRDFKHQMEMYGKLHTAFRKVVDVMTTGRRYLGTYFRIAFFGKPFGDDHEKEFIYKEPKVTTLGELMLRMQKLYARKFGASNIVHIIQEAGKVNLSTLDLEHAYIQITHVEPFFSPTELDLRKTKFERETRISRFVFESAFTHGDVRSADVTKQCMRKTILTTSHWFPYVKKRIPVIDQEQFELSAIEVAIEALERKTCDLSAVVQLEPPDLKRLQLLLQGSISTQVNQGVQVYASFLREPHASTLPGRHTDRLKDVYFSFMVVCQDALELNGRLIFTDQLLYQEELRNKFELMQDTLSPLLQTSQRRATSPPLHTETFPRAQRRPAYSSDVDPHRMSAILFHSISGSK